jgi:hypothetical protein
MASVIMGVLLLLAAIVLWLVSNGSFAGSLAAAGIAMICIGIDLGSIKREVEKLTGGTPSSRPVHTSIFKPPPESENDNQ